MNRGAFHRRCRDVARRHPILVDAISWAIPALIVGAILRLCLLHCLPFAFWGADSRSYFSFAHQLLANHDISLDEKRRYLYPVFMFFVALLPGTPLRWIAILQHTLGVISLLPLAYIVRKNLLYWKLWIIPVTVLYAGLPVIVWYEHELLGETLFFAALLWAFGGWVAWSSQFQPDRTRAFFYWFFVAFAAFILTKPSGRFVWPGIIVGLIINNARSRLGWQHFGALVVLAGVTLTVGSKKQAAWLLYTATFPLTQLDSPLHADFKAEVRDMVEPLRSNSGSYYLHDGEPFEFLENPTRQGRKPLWMALDNDPKSKSKLYMDLAIEGIKAEPVMFAQFGLQRVIGSANLSDFRLDRFTGNYFRTRTEHFYAEGERDESNRVRMAFGLPNEGSIPPYSEFCERLDPHKDSFAGRLVREWMKRIGNSLDLVSMPNVLKAERTIRLARPTPLGWWTMAGLLISFLPAYRRTFGVWTIVALGYLYGVFLVSQANPRYFAPAWIVIVPALALPADLLVSVAMRRSGASTGTK